MRPTLSLSLGSILVGVLLARPAPAHADPVGLALRVVHAQAGGGAPTTPTPAPPAPVPTVQFQSMFGELTGPAETASLPTLLQGAIASEPDLASVRVDREIAEIAIARAQAWREWQVEASASAVVRNSIEQDVTSASLSGAVSRRIFTGGTVGVSVDGGYTSSTRSVTVGGTPAELSQSGFSESVTATYFQPLLRGRGDLELLASERAARANRDAAAIGLDSQVIAVVQGVVLAYLDLTLAERQLAIRQASLELTRERLRVTQAGISAGGTARAELIAVEQSIATREEEILGGELSIIEQSLAIREATGMETAPGQMLLHTEVELAIPEKRWDAQQLLEAALANSPELARLRAVGTAADIQVEVTEHGTLPSLDLALSIGPSGSASSQELDRDGRPLGNGGALGRSLYRTATFADLSANVSLTYRESLGRASAKADAREARARRVLVRISEGEVRRQLGLAVTRAVTQVIAAERRHAIAVRAVALAEQNLVAEQARLSSGKSRNVDVLERQDELRASQLRVAEAIVDWHRAATVIAGLTGELLPQYGVSVR